MAKGLFNFLFPSRKPPEIGDIFCMDSHLDNPFQQLKIVILDVQGKFVSYQYIDDGRIWGVPKSMKIVELNWIYTKVGKYGN